MTLLIVGRGMSPIPNRIANGDFAGNTDGWYGLLNGTTVAFDPDVSLADDGTGSMVLANASGVGRAAYRPGGRMLVELGNETWFDYFASALNPSALGAFVTLRCTFYADASGESQIDEMTSGVATEVNDTWRYLGASKQPVPDGARYALVQIEFTPNVGNDPIHLDHVYFGPSPAFDDPAVSPITDRIPNGTFELDLTGWWGWWGTETIEHETADPISGNGSLTVTTPGGGPEQGVAFPASNGIPVTPGEELRLTFTARGSGEIKAYADYTGASDATLWTGTLTSEPQTVSVDFTVPSGAMRCELLFATTTDQTITFTIDDVSLGPAGS